MPKRIHKRIPKRIPKRSHKGIHKGIRCLRPLAWRLRRRRFMTVFTNMRLLLMLLMLLRVVP
jgi:hypothetical protein